MLRLQSSHSEPSGVPCLARRWVHSNVSFWPSTPTPLELRSIWKRSAEMILVIFSLIFIDRERMGSNTEGEGGRVDDTSTSGWEEGFGSSDQQHIPTDGNAGDVTTDVGDDEEEKKFAGSTDGHTERMGWWVDEKQAEGATVQAGDVGGLGEVSIYFNTENTCLCIFSVRKKTNKTQQKKIYWYWFRSFQNGDFGTGDEELKRKTKILAKLKMTSPKLSKWFNRWFQIFRKPLRSVDDFATNDKEHKVSWPTQYDCSSASREDQQAISNKPKVINVAQKLLSWVPLVILTLTTKNAQRDQDSCQIQNEIIRTMSIMKIQWNLIPLVILALPKKKN